MTIQSGWRPKTRKILVIRMGALGDLVHASAALDFVQQQLPDAEIHLLTSPGYLKLADLMPSVRQIWTWDKQAGWGKYFALIGQLRNERYEAVINLHPSFKTWLLTQWVYPKSQALYHKQKIRKKGIKQRYLERRHATTDFYEPFRRLLKLQSVPILTPTLHLPDGIETPKPAGEIWIGLIPGVGAKRSNRAWLPEAYRQLIRRLLEEPRVRILLLGGSDEGELAAQLTEGAVEQEAQGRVENHCGAHDIPETASLMARCDVVVGGDTGPLHLAAAVGAKFIGLYGPTSLRRTGPVGKQDSLSVNPPEELTCWPCEKPICPLHGKKHLACMKQIEVETIAANCAYLVKTSKEAKINQ